MPRRLAVLLLALAAIAVYWNALDAPFIWDDDIAITTNQSIHEIGESLNPPIETPVSGRPIVNLSFALNYAYGGLDTRGYHVVNLAIHLVCGLLLDKTKRRTLARQLKAATVARRDAIALAPALLWIVPPLLSETVDYTTQRSESLMAIFFLLTLYAAIRARGKKRAGKWTAIAVGSCALGMATKESMVTAPIAVVLYDLIFEFESASEAFAARKGLYLGLAATWLELGAIISHWPRSTVGVAVRPITYLFNQAQIVTRYLWLAVWPPSRVVPILSEVGAERRMYLPLAALSILLVLAMIKFERLASRKVAVAVLA